MSRDLHKSDSARPSKPDVGTGDARLHELLSWARSSSVELSTHLRAFCLELASELSAPSSRAYARRVLFEDEHLELLLVKWAKGRWCAPHDHGGADCRLRRLEGELVDKRFVLEGCELSEQAHSAIVSSADVPMTAWHAMMSPEGALSLHVYESPRATMRVLDIRGRRTLTVRSSHGAFLPDVEDVLKEQRWG